MTSFDYDDVPQEFEEDLIALDYYRNPRTVRIMPMMPEANPVDDMIRTFILAAFGLAAFLGALALISYAS